MNREPINYEVPWLAIDVLAGFVLALTVTGCGGPNISIRQPDVTISAPPGLMQPFETLKPAIYTDAKTAPIDDGSTGVSEGATAPKAPVATIAAPKTVSPISAPAPAKSAPVPLIPPHGPQETGRAPMPSAPSLPSAYRTEHGPAGEPLAGPFWWAVTPLAQWLGGQLKPRRGLCPSRIKSVEIFRLALGVIDRGKACEDAFGIMSGIEHEMALGIMGRDVAHLRPPLAQWNFGRAFGDDALRGASIGLLALDIGDLVHIEPRIKRTFVIRAGRSERDDMAAR